MPFATGSWGEQAQKRSVQRHAYFLRYRALHKNKILDNIRRFARYHIPIPKGYLCERCYDKPATNRHHKDYLNPLEVILLCGSCHKQIHLE